MISSTLSKPAKWFIRSAIIAVLSVALVLLKIEIAQSVISVIYTVNGIMFSVALSLLVSFSFTEIENNEFVQRQRGQLSYLRIVFIILFALSTIAFIFADTKWKGNLINPICFSVIIFCLIYNVVNFCDMAKAKEEIENKIREARKKK